MKSSDSTTVNTLGCLPSNLGSIPSQGVNKLNKGVSNE